MASPRCEAQFRRARWTRRLLIPVWVLQMIMTLGLVGLFSWRVGHTMKNHRSKRTIPTIEYVWQATNIGMALLAAICSFVEVIRYLTEVLTPWNMLFSNVIKLASASAILALDIVAHILLSEKRYSLISLGVDGVLLRTAAYDEHSYPPNVKLYGFSDGDPAYKLSAGNRASLGSARLSIGSARQPFNPEFPSQPLNQYSHQRDTQFEEYVARRVSMGDYPATNRDSLLSPLRLSPPQSASSDLRISNGSVNALQRGSTRPRSTSWQSDQALISVPEEEREPAGQADEVSLLTLDQKEAASDDVGLELDSDESMSLPKWRQNRV